MSPSPTHRSRSRGWALPTVTSLVCLAVALLTSVGCEDTQSPVSSSYAPPDSFRLPTFANEWTAVEQPGGDPLLPGTSTVTREGTILVQASWKVYEYKPNGAEIGTWPMTLDDDTLNVVHVRYRYGRYYAFAWSRASGDQFLAYDIDRKLLYHHQYERLGGTAVPFASFDVDPCGNVYKLEFYQELVVKYDRNGEYLTQWSTHGSNPTGYSWPGGIVVGGRGRVYVSDTLHNRILVFDDGGTLLDEWGVGGGGPGQYRWPCALDSDRLGFLYVVDRLNHRIQKLTSDGLYLGEFSSFITSSDGYDETPDGIAVGDRDVYVVHIGARLIRRFTFDGTSTNK